MTINFNIKRDTDDYNNILLQVIGCNGVIDAELAPGEDINTYLYAGCDVRIMEKSSVKGYFDFSFALRMLKVGHKMARSGWNGKDMFVYRVPGSVFKVNRPPLLGIYPEGHEVHYNSHLDIKRADGTIEPWLAAQCDLFAEDWYIVEEV